MMLKNNEHPRGIYMGGVSFLPSVLDLSYVAGGMGLRQGTDYRAFGNRIRRPLKVAKPKPTPILLHIECPVCKKVVETYRTQQVYCSVKCRDRRHWQLDPRKKRRKNKPVPVITCGHADRKVMAKGMCRPCYDRSWRESRKAA